jgi:hypothetical protein
MGEGAPPPGKRPFVPPPWEQEQFERLAKRRAAEAAQADTPAPAVSGPEPDTSDTASVISASPKPQQARAAAEPQASLDERETQAMLVQLSSEEASVLVPARRAGKWIAVALAAIGLALTVLGAKMSMDAVGAPAAGTLGAGTTLLIGLLVTGGAVWLWIRANRG